MKTLKSILVVTVILFGNTIMYGQATPKDFPVLKGPYFGQTPPGLTPIVFAPGIV